MPNSDPNTYSFNNQDYSFEIKLWNGVSSVQLTNTAWDDLVLEDNLFDIFVKGSITVNTPYNILERSTNEANENVGQKLNLEYKFRNDGRDTLYLSIKPNSDNQLDQAGITLEDSRWLIELEMVIYDVQDLPSDDTSAKKKKLYFWEKTYQMMKEKDSEFSTATTGPNANKQGQDQANDDDRSLSTGDALIALLQNDPLFYQYIGDTSAANWNKGDATNLLFYTSPVGSKFINDLMYIYDAHVASAAEGNQPCILKLERAQNKGQVKTFSLKTIEQYFKQAGTSNPGKYQLEHFFIRESDEQNNSPIIKKAPLSTSQTTEIKADEFNIVRGYRLVDLAGGDYANNLANRRIVSYNSSDKQINVEAKLHSSTEWKTFFNERIKPNVLVSSGISSDRLPVTPYIENGLNTITEFSTRPTDAGRLIEGRNKIIKYYLFSNLCISITTRGLTHRQPGRFFGLSKQSLNDKEYDHKLEGQYFITNVKHHFSNTERGYYTEILGVKPQVYREDTPLPKGDVILIGQNGDELTPLPASQTNSSSSQLLA